MRKISKRQPPKNVSHDGQQAQTLAQAEQALLAGLRGLTSAYARTAHARDTHFDALNKHVVRKALLAEQGSICVYCERHLEIPEDEGGNPTEKGLPIEHWRPLSRDPELALTWKNLYLSCAFIGTCDNAKKNKPLAWADEDEDLPWPPDASYERWIGVNRDGTLYVRTDAPISPERRRALELAIEDRDENGRRRHSVLNLNHPALISARESAIKAEARWADRNYRGQTISMEDRHAQAQALREKNPLPSFISARVAWWTRELGKGR